MKLISFINYLLLLFLRKGKNMDPRVECEGSKANFITEVLFR